MDRDRRVRGWSIVTTLAAVLLAGCSGEEFASGAGASLAGGCSLNSDCSTGLVCGLGKCHTACASSVDCADGARCVTANGTNVCQLPTETKCSYTSDCTAPLVCGPDAKCRNQCQADRDCLAGQKCVSGVCADSTELNDAGQLAGGEGGASDASADAVDADETEACSSPLECPEPTNPCLTRVCIGGLCGTGFAQADTPLPSQTPGDCKVVVCNGNGATTSQADPSDVPAGNGNLCTSAVCNGSTPEHLFKPQGTPCDVHGVCDGSGDCGVAALWVNSPDGRVEIPSSAALDIGKNVTIELWFYLLDYSGQYMFQKWVSGEESKFLGLDPVTPSSHRAYTGFYCCIDLPSTLGPPTVAKWHHLAASYGNGVLQLYQDGAPAGTQPFSADVGDSHGTLYVGFSASRYSAEATGLPINGYLAEVRISSTAKYTSAFTPPPRLTVETDTVALWHLDEGTGTTINDSGPNHLTGALKGSAQWVVAPAR